MLGLLLCAILSEYSQPGVITQAGLSLRARTDRMYKDSPTTFFGQTLITLFRLGTLAMALCMCFSANGHFSFLTYLAANGLIIAVLLVKMLCNVLLDYTFMLSRRFGAMHEHYSNIGTLACLILWPAILILQYCESTQANRWTLGVTAILFFGLWIYRSSVQYMRSPMAVVYLLLYWCTLELLPAAVLIYLSAKTITTI